LNAILRPAVCAKLLTIEIFLDGETCKIFSGGYEYAPDYDQLTPVTRSPFQIVADHAGNSMPRALRPLEAVGPQNQSHLLSRKCCLLLAQKTEVQNRPA
jgi:hypothetical protein